MGLNSAFYLSKMLMRKKYSFIKILNLSNNNLCDDGTKILTQYFKDNKSLITLNLSSNNLTSVGAKYIFDALE